LEKKPPKKIVVFYLKKQMFGFEKGALFEKREFLVRDLANYY